MRCVAALEVKDHHAYDAIIVWGDEDRLVAYAYKHGQVVATRPVPDTEQAAVEDLQAAWQLDPGQVMRLA